MNEERISNQVGSNDLTLGASGEGIYALVDIADAVASADNVDGVKTILKKWISNYWMRCAYQGWFKFLLVRTAGTLTNNLNASINGNFLDTVLAAAINDDFSFEEISDWLTLTSQGLATNGYGDNYSFSRYSKISLSKRHIRIVNKCIDDEDTDDKLILVVLISTVANAAAAYRMQSSFEFDQDRQGLTRKL